MRKILFTNGLQTFLTALICFVAVSSIAMGSDRFAVIVGAHDKLVIFAPNGDRAAELSAPAIAQTVALSDASFQVSYGINSDQRLTAILAPNATAPVDLHFIVCGKHVDADKNAVVTLVFSPNGRSVTVSAGRTGRVEVNSHRVLPSVAHP
jgi:hypothetical protein